MFQITTKLQKLIFFMFKTKVANFWARVGYFQNTTGAVQGAIQGAVQGAVANFWARTSKFDRRRPGCKVLSRAPSRIFGLGYRATLVRQGVVQGLVTG